MTSASFSFPRRNDLTWMDWTSKNNSISSTSYSAGGWNVSSLSLECTRWPWRFQDDQIQTTWKRNDHRVEFFEGHQLPFATAISFKRAQKKLISNRSYKSLTLIADRFSLKWITFSLFSLQGQRNCSARGRQNLEGNFLLVSSPGNLLDPLAESAERNHWLFCSVSRRSKRRRRRRKKSNIFSQFEMNEIFLSFFFP